MRHLAWLTLVATGAFAQTIYTWEDRDGVHYTDDVNQVPTALRAKLGEPTERAEAAWKLARSAKPEAAPSPPTTARPAAPSPALEAESRGGVTEAEWRVRFQQAHQGIDSLERQIKAMRAVLPAPVACVPTAAPPVTGDHQVVVVPAPCAANPEYDRQRAEIARLEVSLADAKVALDQLERDASLASVPREWRRGF